MTANFQRLWVDDGPNPLIETPLKKIQAEGREPSVPEEMAIEMAHVHNMMIRGLNCVLLQTPNIKEVSDQQDMITYAFALCQLIHDHHHTEETLMFPLIEKITGVKGLMDVNVIQHEAFQGQFHIFSNYVDQMKNGVAEWDSERFVRSVEDFALPLTLHLTAEIKTLVSLEKYKDANWGAMLKQVADYAIAHIEKEYGMPYALAHCDVTYEDNIHRGKWPPMPWFIMAYFKYMYYPKHKTAWRYAACNASGFPQELPFAPVKGSPEAERVLAEAKRRFDERMAALESAPVVATNAPVVTTTA